MPDLRNFLDDECPIEKGHPKGKKVWYSNGYPGPGSTEDKSEVGCYRYSWLHEGLSIDDISANLRAKAERKDLFSRIGQQDTTSEKEDKGMEL